MDTKKACWSSSVLVLPLNAKSLFSTQINKKYPEKARGMSVGANTSMFSNHYVNCFKNTIKILLRFVNQYSQRLMKTVEQILRLSDVRQQ